MNLSIRLHPYDLRIEPLENGGFDVYLKTQVEDPPRIPWFNSQPSPRAALQEAARLAELLPCRACPHESCAAAQALADSIHAFLKTP